MWHHIHFGHLWELIFRSCSCDLPNQIQVRIWDDRQGNGVLFDCQGIFSYAWHFNVCAEYLFSFRRWGKLFRDILKCLRKKFSAVSIRVKQKCSFLLCVCDRSQAILVKHPFPLSHLRALTILLFESMVILQQPFTVCIWFKRDLETRG